jgi:hypothetical protein
MMEENKQSMQHAYQVPQHMIEVQQPNRLGYFLGGTALGICLGILFAPKNGKETRQDINDWLKEKREQWNSRAQEKKDVLGLRGERVTGEPVGARK